MHALRHLANEARVPKQTNERRQEHWIDNPLNPPGVRWVNFLGESQSRLYPHMCAKFGRGPTLVSKNGSLKFNNRW